MSQVDIEHLKEELLKLKEWRDEVGIPATEKNEELSLVIEQITIANEECKTQIDVLSQEKQTLQLEAQTYQDEISRVTQENKEYVEQIEQLQQSGDSKELLESSIQQLHVKDAAIDSHKEKLDELNKENISLSALTTELTKEINHLKLENQQY
eukprot:360331_1